MALQATVISSLQVFQLLYLSNTKLPQATVEHQSVRQKMLEYTRGHAQI